MRRSLSAPDWACLGLALAAYVVSFLFYTTSPLAQDGFLLCLYAVVLGAAMLSAAAEILAVDRFHYLGALLFRSALSLLALLFCAGVAGADVPLFVVLVLSASLHHPYPRNLVVGVLLVAGGTAVSAAVVFCRGAGWSTVGPVVTNMLWAGVATGITTSLMSCYRERLIEKTRESDHLHEVVDRLTRVNLSYQEYARTVSEASTEEERKRIIRDVHDIVGYTLTNTITMMEAITDLMRTNPVGVASLVRAARENAQEGLDRVRGALYRLKGQEVCYPTGWRGVERLITVFQRATGVTVELMRSDTGLVWRDADPLEETIYHIVQGSLLNAFRHGKATNVRIFVDGADGFLSLRVRDNGSGPSLPRVSEGIGLTGMRERVQKLGGSLQAGPTPAGFEICARIPMGATGAARGG
jgi:signal transduction histidine kinase